MISELSGVGQVKFQFSLNMMISLYILTIKYGTTSEEQMSSTVTNSRFHEFELYILGETKSLHF